MHGLLQLKIKFYRLIRLLFSYVHEVNVISTTFNHIMLLTVQQEIDTGKNG